MLKRFGSWKLPLLAVSISLCSNFPLLSSAAQASPDSDAVALSMHGPIASLSGDKAQDSSAVVSKRCLHESRLNGLGHRQPVVLSEEFSVAKEALVSRAVSSSIGSSSPSGILSSPGASSAFGSSSLQRSSSATTSLSGAQDLPAASQTKGSAFRVPAWLNRVKEVDTTSLNSTTQVSFADTTNSGATSAATKGIAASGGLALSAADSILFSSDETNSNLIASNQGIEVGGAAVLNEDASATTSPVSQNSYSSEPEIADVPAAMTPQAAVLADPDATSKLAQNANTPGASTSAAPQTDAAPGRRSYPAPLDPVFCMSEYPGSAGTMPIGVPDSDPEYPLEKAIYKILPELKKHRVKIYGWANPGGGYSSSHHSNIPISYPVVPNRLEMDQLILRVERIPDTVQNEHCDWGFRSSMLYGIDYRFTTAQGWYPATTQLLRHNDEYGFDPVELYGMFYVPKIAGHKIFQGMMLKFGRYISPPDIEAQLAPDNFLWTHSQMFTVDCYTQTGFLSSIKLNDNLMIQAGVHAGDDIAPWDKAAIPTGEFFVRWVSKSNNDSIYGGVDSINNGRFRGARAVIQDQNMIAAVNGLIRQQAANGGSLGPYQNFNGTPYQFNNLQPVAHDNLQQFNVTWSHRFNKKGTIATFTEAYFLYQYNALTGGTVNNGPPHNYAGLTGPGTYINGIAPVVGVVNYTAFKITDKDYVCLRPVDYLIDYKGERTGFPTTLSSWTVGWCHRFSDLVLIRPEIRYDRALNYHDGTIVTPYDNGTRRFQFTFGLDCIARF